MAKKKKKAKGKSVLAKIAQKRLEGGPGALTGKEQERLIKAGGGGFTQSTKKKTRKLAKR